MQKTLLSMRSKSVSIVKAETACKMFAVMDKKLAAG